MNLIKSYCPNVLINELEKYFCDMNYVYSSYNKKYVCIWKKIDGTITDELRQNIYDPFFAKYNANILQCVMIFNKFDPTKKYNINAEHNRFNVCYYKSIVPAYYDELYDTEYVGEWYDWYDSGQILCHGYYDNGKPSGLWKQMHENGNVASIGEYHDGKKDKIWQYLYSNESIQTSCYYVDGKLFGKLCHYDENGKQLEEIDFVNDKMSGVYKKWIDGSLKIEGIYYNGMEHGEWKYYDDNDIIDRGYILI